jgi:hypothetical protein
MRKYAPTKFEKTKADVKSDKGVKESSKKDMAKDKAMMKGKMK